MFALLLWQQLTSNNRCVRSIVVFFTLLLFLSFTSKVINTLGLWDFSIRSHI